MSGVVVSESTRRRQRGKRRCQILKSMRSASLLVLAVLALNAAPANSWTIGNEIHHQEGTMSRSNLMHIMLGSAFTPAGIICNQDPAYAAMYDNGPMQPVCFHRQYFLLA